MPAGSVDLRPVHPRVSVSAISTRSWTLDEDLAFYATAGIANVYVKLFSGGNWNALAAGSASGSGVSASATSVADLALATDGAKVAIAWTQLVGGVKQIYMKEFAGAAFNEIAGSASTGGASNTAGDSSSPALAYLGPSLFAFAFAFVFARVRRGSLGLERALFLGSRAHGCVRS